MAHALGTAYRVAGDVVRARDWLTRAAALDPEDLLSWKDLSEVAAQTGSWPEVARACSRRAALAQSDANAWLLWGHALQVQHRFRAALSVLLRGWRHNREHPKLNAAVGAAYSDIGQSGRSVRFLRRAKDAEPGDSTTWCNLLFAITADDSSDAEEQADEHRRFGALYPAAKRDRVHPRKAGKRIRIGYVSADFRRHPLERFYTSILSHHDRSQFEVYAYSSTPSADDSTARYRSWCEHWREVAGIDDEDFPAVVARDHPDILVDLSGHTSGNRLGAFARRAAPVQLSHCGYPNTTGLKQMDWYITDSVADPSGLSERHFTESLLRIDPCFLCYTPSALATAAEIPHELRHRPVTFGCFNPLRKLSESTLDLWARVLDATPRSRLLLQARAFDDPGVAVRLKRRFARQGIDPDRIDCQGFTRDEAAYFAAYHEVDIALDPFPYNGATVSCDALWMGVPVIAKTGSTHASRVAASILRAAGMPECVASSAEEYVRLASDMASDAQWLRGSRVARRALAMASPLMDATAYVRHFEKALRDVFANALRRTPGA